MKNKLAYLVLSLSVTSSFAAESYLPTDHQIGGLGIMRLSEGDADVSALVGSLSSKHSLYRQLSVVPELRLGVGLDEDSVAGVDYKLNYFMALSANAQFDVTESFYAFAGPTYAFSDVKTSSGFVSVSDSDSQFALGFGAGYVFRNGMAVELSYEKFSETKITSVDLEFPM